MAFIADPLFYAVAVPAILVVGLSKSGFLSGLAVLGVPLLSLVIAPVQAAGILLPILIAMDVVGVWAYRKTFDKRSLAILLPAAVIGIVAGYLTAARVSEADIRLLVGVIALGFTLHYWLEQSRGGTSGPPRQISGAFGVLAGTVAGFTSFVSHAGSPPVQMFLLPQRLRAVTYAGTMAMFFASINLIKVPPYFLLGQFSWENLATAALLLPLAPLSMAAGIKLMRHVRQEPFYKLAYGCLLIVSVKLIYDGLQSWV